MTQHTNAFLAQAMEKHLGIKPDYRKPTERDLDSTGKKKEEPVEGSSDRPEDSEAT